jgi:hypothetical protein
MALTGIPAALLEGALVMLPRTAPFPRLARLRSPGWTALLPVSIIVGTFGLLAAPGLAPATVLAAAVITPALAFVAAAAVARGRLVMLPVAAAACALAVLAKGPSERLATAVLIALACLTVGAALQRLIPGRWLLVGVLAMAVVDVSLLAFGPGYHQTALLAAASNNFHGPPFVGARVGQTTIGFPDLFLAALLGASLAGDRNQLRAAGLLVGLAVAYDSLLAPGRLLPATVPIALTLLIVSFSRRRRGRGHTRRRYMSPSEADIAAQGQGAAPAQPQLSCSCASRHSLAKTAAAKGRQAQVCAKPTRGRSGSERTLG